MVSSNGPAGRLLSSRSKEVNVFLLPNERQYHVQAEMRDRVHHMRITMTVNEPTLKIVAFDCEMLSVPDEVCREALGSLDGVVGRRIVPGLTREMQPKAGGCTHLMNLFHEACYNITQAQAVHGRENLTRAFHGISEAQLYHIFLWFKPELENSCVRYQSRSAFMQAVKACRPPHGSESLKALARQLKAGRTAQSTEVSNGRGCT